MINIQIKLFLCGQKEILIKSMPCHKNVGLKIRTNINVNESSELKRLVTQVPAYDFLIGATSPTLCLPSLVGEAKSGWCFIRAMQALCSHQLAEHILEQSVVQSLSSYIFCSEVFFVKKITQLFQFLFIIPLTVKVCKSGASMATYNYIRV